MFVLGAGFSHAAGVPLGDELWTLTRERALEGPGADGFRMDLKTYLNYRRECDGVVLDPEDVDYEEFLAFLDIEHSLGLAGPNTWSSHGNKTQVLIKTRLAELLVQRTPAPADLPSIYHDFAKDLGEGDVVLSFNYDTVLERALDHVGKPYRLWLHRDDPRELYERDNEVVVLKLHGSVDWFDRTEDGLAEEHGHLVFGSGSPARVVPLTTSIEASDPMANFHRVVNGLEELYRRPLLFRATPCLLTPSKAKVVYASSFAPLWCDVVRVGRLKLGVVVIGYSLPSHDEHARQALFRLCHNYQDNWWDMSWTDGRKKAPILLIDKQESDDGRKLFLRKYGFINPKRAVVHFDGFDGTAMTLIRNSSGCRPGS